jgi:D-amino-acid dehydrogenase
MYAKERIQDLVIGAGAVGVACAEALSAAGREVVLVDQGTVCSGCSHGNAGWVTPCHSLPMPGPGLVAQSLKWMLQGDSPLYIQPTLKPSMLAWLWRFYRHCNRDAQLRGLTALAALNRDVVPLTREVVERCGLDCQFEQRGILYVFRTQADFDKGVKECNLLDEHDIPGEIISRADMHARQPMLNTDVCGGVRYSGEADCVPDQFVKQLAEKLPQRGVRILTETAVSGFEISGNKIESLITSAGTFQPENVILAAGSWTSPLARQLGVRLPLQPGKGYSVTLKQQPGTPTEPLNLSEAKVAVTPWKDTVRLAGTMELAGLQLKINQRRVDAVIRAAKSFLPQFQAEEIQEVWTGMRPVTSDGLPIIGRSGKLNNLILATGHAMLGLTQAVVTGRMVAEIVTGQPPLVPIEPFSPDR